MKPIPQGDYECTRHFSATILADDMPVGSFLCTLIGRTAYGGISISLGIRRGVARTGRCRIVSFSASGEPRTAALERTRDKQAASFTSESSPSCSSHCGIRRLGTTAALSGREAPPIILTGSQAILALDDSSTGGLCHDCVGSPRTPRGGRGPMKKDLAGNSPLHSS